MPREARPWFRFYCEAVWDRKLRRLDPDLRWLWVVILSAARQSSEPGRLLLTASAPMVVDDLADAANMPADRVEAGLRAMLDLELLTVDGETWVVSKWSERQFESDSSTERSRRSRSDGDATSQRRSNGDAATRSDSDPDTEPPSISGLVQYGLDEQVVVDLLARHDLAAVKAKGTQVSNEDGWLVTGRRTAARKYAGKAREVAATFQVDSERQLVEFVTGGRRPTVADRRAS
jgi:hypothetical protein